MHADKEHAMISANPRFAMLAVIFSVLVIAGILYGLFGDSLGMRNVYRAPVGSATPADK